MHDLPRTLGLLRAHGGFPPRTVKEELRRNLATALRHGHPLSDILPGLIGYEDTVLPQVANALLAGHDLLLLGLRGQAKTRLARALAGLLDPAVPALAGDPLRSHPLAPIGPIAEDLVARQGDDAPVVWLTPAQRYGEKLATPDVAVADLIGDLDPIRAHREGHDLGDLRSVTFGIIPRTNRGIFCINELPDLAPRIQVALFNLLEEHDVQVRGIPLRLPTDLLLVFTANPEDYTSRGRIITPLKDRIGSQILTHYPTKREDGIAILRQEAAVVAADDCTPVIPALFDELIEETARAARVSDFTDASSGVSARLTIAARELVAANVLRRGLLHGQVAPRARLVDLAAALAAITGKVELAYEGEQEGPAQVGWRLLGEGLKGWWATRRLPPVVTEDGGDERDQGPWAPVLRWFATGHRVDLTDDSVDAAHVTTLAAVPGLADLASRLLPELEPDLGQELLLEGLFHGGALARQDSVRGLVYSDLLAHLMRQRSAEA